MQGNRRFTIQDYAFVGVWKNHNEPAFKSWTLTLSDPKALLSLAILSILLAYTQTKMWAIVRYIVYQRSKSPRLGGSGIADSRLTLSQSAAMRETLPSVKMAVVRWFRQHLRLTSGCPREGNDVSTDGLSISPYFGITALINVIIFLFMAVFIPWALTNGSLETPTIKSKVTEQCLKAEKYEVVDDFFADQFQADAILQQCRNRLDDTCSSQYYLKEPKVASSLIDACPFLGDGVCRNDTKTLEIIHEDIGAYEAGVNSPAKLMMNHRIRCAPIDLHEFYLFRTDLVSNLNPDDGNPPTYTAPDGSRKAVVEAIITMKPRPKQQDGRFVMRLRTLNGPNSISKKNSGRLLAERGTLSDITVLPRVLADFDTRELLPELRLHDAMPFLAVYRAGARRFSHPVDDPFFSSHNLKGNSSWYADREATALGCAEQFQFCRRKQQDCTPWGRGSSMLYPLLNISDTSSAPSDDEKSEAIALFGVLPTAFSVYNYLAWHIGASMAMDGSSPLIAAGAPSPFITTTRYRDNQDWTLQVETWFTKAILSAIFYMRFGAKVPLDRDSERFSREWKKKSALCGRILFQHPGYTNINFVGALCTMVALSIICFGSRFLDSIWKTSKRVSTLAKLLASRLGPFHFLRSLRSGVGGLVTGGSGINMSNLDAEIADDPVNSEYEDIDAVISGLARASTV